MTIWTDGQVSSNVTKTSVRVLGTGRSPPHDSPSPPGRLRTSEQAHATLCCLLSAQRRPAHPSAGHTPGIALLQGGRGEADAQHVPLAPGKRPICPPEQPPHVTRKQGASPSRPRVGSHLLSAHPCKPTVSILSANSVQSSSGLGTDSAPALIREQRDGGGGGG